MSMLVFLGGFGCGVAATLLLAVVVGHRGQVRVKVSNMDTVEDLTRRLEDDTQRRVRAAVQDVARELIH